MLFWKKFPSSFLLSDRGSIFPIGDGDDTHLVFFLMNIKLSDVILP